MKAIELDYFFARTYNNDRCVERLVSMSRADLVRYLAFEFRIHGAYRRLARIPKADRYFVRVRSKWAANRFANRVGGTATIHRSGELTGPTVTI